jgi:hypothetical protein
MFCNRIYCVFSSFCMQIVIVCPHEQNRTERRSSSQLVKKILRSIVWGQQKNLVETEPLKNILFRDKTPCGPMQINRFCLHNFPSFFSVYFLPWISETLHWNIFNFLKTVLSSRFPPMHWWDDFISYKILANLCVLNKKLTKLRGLSPRANYTDQATAAYQRS